MFSWSTQKLLCSDIFSSHTISYLINYRLVSSTIYSFLGRNLPSLSVCKHRLGSISQSLGGVAPAVREGIRSLLPKQQSTRFPAAGRATQHSTPNSEIHWMYPLKLHFAAAGTYGAKEVERKGRQTERQKTERENRCSSRTARDQNAAAAAVLGQGGWGNTGSMRWSKVEEQSPLSKANSRNPHRVGIHTVLLFLIQLNHFTASFIITTSNTFGRYFFIFIISAA